jgi:Flp pilus assembly protein CpaB
VYVYKNLQSKTGSSADAGVDVIVAADDLQVGARVEEHDIKVIRISRADLPPSAPRKRADVLGHGVIVPFPRENSSCPTGWLGRTPAPGCLR